MAVSLQSYEVSDLCLGKPALYWLPITATVGEALKALKELKPSHETELSVWNCTHNNKKITANVGDEQEQDCKCLGKICMVDIICYLSCDESLCDPARALSAPITTLLPRVSTRVRLVDPHLSLLKALDLILDGAQNLIVPIEGPKRLSFKKPSQKIGCAAKISPASHEGKEFCWITQEDVLRFLLGFIGAFSPLPSMTIEDLGIVETEVLMVEYNQPAATALNLIKQAYYTQTAVAVVEQDPLQGPKLIGEISPSTLMCCDETVALALATLSAGDLMAYVDCGGPAESLVEIVKRRMNLKLGLDGEREEGQQRGGSIAGPHGLFPGRENGMTDPWEESSDEEFYDGSPSGPLHNARKWHRSCSFKSNKVVYASRSCRASPLTCKPWNSLVAVMAQALAHRVNYVWVTDEDSNLVGVVTTLSILSVFGNHVQSLD
uniref:TSA: Wollemia nobilis Ref_Wollemi_Transcript_8820_1905 transcribed RNA sequence n=1 Tax=Wollemia nobilis TaxID=56998 RepID=A0A0C9QUF8_9CONI